MIFCRVGLALVDKWCSVQAHLSGWLAKGYGSHLEAIYIDGALRHGSQLALMVPAVGGTLR